MGEIATCSGSYLEFCNKIIKHANLTVIFHPKNVGSDDIAQMRDCGVKTVRICFPVQNPTLGFKAIETAKQNKLETFVNIVRVSQYTPKQILDWAIELEKHDVDAIYLADSNGNLTPNKTKGLYSLLKNNCQAPLGFHAHDNLFLAQANAVSAIKEGAQLIDASVVGFGKGSGNLRTEGIVSFLYSQGIVRYDLCKVLEAAQYMNSKFHNVKNHLSIKDIILGVFNLSQDDAVNLGDFLNTKDYYSKAQNYCQNQKLLAEA